MNSEMRSIDGSCNVESNAGHCDLLKHDESNKIQCDPYKEISINFNGLENGMEFLSVAAGVTAKDKRIKDAKNQAAAASKDNKDMITNFSSKKFLTFMITNNMIFPLVELVTFEDFLMPPNSSSSVTNCGGQLVLPQYPDILISGDTTLSQLLATLQEKGQSLAKPCITLDLVCK